MKLSLPSARYEKIIDLVPTFSKLFGAFLARVLATLAAIILSCMLKPLGETLLSPTEQPVLDSGSKVSFRDMRSKVNIFFVRYVGNKVDSTPSPEQFLKNSPGMHRMNSREIFTWFDSSSVKRSQLIYTMP